MTPPTATTPARLAIIGTAGHIDHGKTALVRRLTGVDTDRLPEEKQRGISIDLGFAPLVTPAGVHAGIVDVPGHERFVKNMLAGVGGVDLVLLVIAADEGVMPQTREHLAIVQLLGVTRGIVVLSKSDLVDAEWRAEVAREVSAALAGGPLAKAPIIEFSAVTGAGRDALLAEIDRQLAARPPDHAPDAPARLPIDRVFTMEGFGTVVTGTLWRGAIATGDTLELLPLQKSVRVRRVQVHGTTVERALAGQRTAIAIHGVEKKDVARGDWLAAPGALRPSRLLDVRFELLPDVSKPWPHHTRVRFHLGASEILGRLVLLEGETLAPGANALAQLRLDEPAVASRGDRFVIRSDSPARTIGGGSVIEPLAARRHRRGAGLEALVVHEGGSLEARLLERLTHETRPASTAVLAQAVGESERAVGEALARLRDAAELVATTDGRWIATARWDAARDTIERDVRRYVEQHPARYGVMKGELKNQLKGTLDPALFDAAFESLVTDSALELRGARVRPRDTPWEPPPASLAALERLERELEAKGFSVPETSEWQKARGAEAAELSALGYFLDRLVRVSDEYTYGTRQMAELRAKLSAHFATHETMTMAEFKALAGVSRKYAVPLLEHTDRVGWTIRVGDDRKPGGKLEAMP